MFRLIFNFGIIALIHLAVGTKYEQPISTVSVYHYGEPPKSGSNVFFSDYSSNVFYPPYGSCYNDIFNVRGHYGSPYSSNYYHQNPFYSYHVSMKDLFYSPIFVATRSLKTPDSIDIHFAPRGFYSIYNEPHFNSVKMFMLTPTEKAGVVFHPKNFFNFRMFNMKTNNFVVSDDFSFGDFVKTINNVNYIPMFGVFEKYDCESFHFDKVYEFGKIGVYEHYVEPVYQHSSPEKTNIRP